MKVELRGLKFYPRLTQETNAFSATIYINGKKSGECSNDGHGGCADYHFTDHKVGQAFEDYVSSLPFRTWEHDGEKFSLKRSPHDFLDELANEIIDAKEREKEAKKEAKTVEKWKSMGYNLILKVDKGFMSAMTAYSRAEKVEEKKKELALKHKAEIGQVSVLWEKAV
jgi:mRNA-degrading endonuclease RelE of RelBE toxin-antitoxin system